MTSKEQEIQLSKTQKKAGKAINSYQLIEEGDTVLVALSGGIDSFVLLDILHERLKKLPIHYTITAIHVEIEDLPVQTDIQYIKEFCKNRKIPVKIEKVKYQKETEDKKFDCFPCSWNRRKAIFKKAEELNCNKVAFGHHMDDALETLLMNMIHHAEISAFPPKLNMRKGNFEIIRPLILCSANEVKEYAQLKNIKPAEGDCPYGTQSHREVYKEIIKKIDGIHNLAKINLFNSMDNIFPEYLPGKPNKKK